MTESRLRQLLVDAMTDVGHPLDVEQVRRSARVRRRVTRLTAASGVLVLLALVAGVIAQTSTTPTARLVSDPPAHEVVVEGISYPILSGWTEAEPNCWASNHTVVVGYWTGHCPARMASTATATWVTVAPSYGPQSYGGSHGTREAWKGQPAWIAQEKGPEGTTVTLHLPWLNAVVSATAPDAAEGRRLVDLAVPHPVSGLAVPNGAASVRLDSFTGHDGDGQDRSRVITSPTDVQRLLEDLRALPVTSDPTKACDDAVFDPQSVTVSVATASGRRTYQVRFGCGQVIAGTGVAGLIQDSRLLDDVRRLLPNSGLDPAH